MKCNPHPEILRRAARARLPVRGRLRARARPCSRRRRGPGRHAVQQPGQAGRPHRRRARERLVALRFGLRGRAGQARRPRRPARPSTCGSPPEPDPQRRAQRGQVRRRLSRRPPPCCWRPATGGCARSASPSTSARRCSLPQAWRAPLRAVAQVLRASWPRSRCFSRWSNVGGGFPARYAEHGLPPLVGLTRRRSQLGWPDCPTRCRSVPSSPAGPWSRRPAPCGPPSSAPPAGHGRRWIHLDVGAFNGLMEAWRPATSSASRSPTRGPPRPASAVHLTGPTCDSQDTIMFDVELSAGLAVGDRVWLGTAGRTRPATPAPSTAFRCR